MARERRQGSETPRIWTKPLRELTPDTSLGFAVITFADAIGIWLYPWQRWLLIHMLELLPSGRLRFRKIVIIVGRQNGKSTLMKVLALWFLYVHGTRLILGTAQDLETAEKLWEEAVEIAEGDEDLDEEIKTIARKNGSHALILHSGNRYQVKAANRRAGRGKSAQVVLLDELREHTSWEAWAAIANTTMAQEEAMVIAPSNAGDLTSVVLRSLRRQGHLALGDPDGTFAATTADERPDDVEGLDEVDDLALFEWSSHPKAGPWDRDAWAMANPSMNVITPDGRNALPESNIASAARTGEADSEAMAKFLNEVMCQWIDGAREGPFPPGSWAAACDPTSRVPDDAPLSYGLDVSKDRGYAYVAWAGLREDGNPHAEVPAARAGTEWVVPWFAKRATADNPMTVVAQGRGAPVSDLLDDLEALEHVTVVRLQGEDLGHATGRLWRLVKAALPPDPARPVDLGTVTLDHPDDDVPAHVGRRLFHMPQELLDVAAANAAVKVSGDGALLWDRNRSPVDIAPLVALTAAVWHATRIPEPSAPEPRIRIITGG
ncbi:terminase large subunit domain-containing protein [Cellulosimicrobium funkei]|uniref:terminase large subunit domain-containing protein n=1 Tax=Cellulosimicrobium funkei TaxID=264251 RepID=UPI0034446275